MAKEAIIKIKEAEDKGNALIQKANEQAKQILKNAETEGDEKAKEIIKEAQTLRLDIIEKARAEAIKECEPLLKEGDASLEGILKPDSGKWNKTIQLITERIVNVNGSR